jgi:polyhydroxybutyrate depolymerase
MSRRAGLIFGVVVSGWATLAMAQSPSETTGSLMFEGRERTFSFFVPPRSAPAGLPLVVALHGGFGNGADMARMTAFTPLAAKEGFIVVYPDAFADPSHPAERHWNDGRAVLEFYSQRENVDDVGFLTALVSSLEVTQGVDKARVYITGISNGGLMAFRMACEASLPIAALAPVAATIPANIAATCAPQRPLPIALIEGTDDPIMPMQGGTVQPNQGLVISLLDTMAFWINTNGCPAVPDTFFLPPPVPDDGTRVSVSSRSCLGNNDLLLFSVIGGGHTWPGTSEVLSRGVVGVTSQAMDTTSHVWAFFASHTSGG